MPESVCASSNTSDGDVVWTVDAMFPKSHARLCFPALIIISHFPLEIGPRMDIFMQLVYWYKIDTNKRVRDEGMGEGEIE